MSRKGHTVCLWLHEHEFILFCVCCLYHSICEIYIVLYVQFIFCVCSLYYSICAVYIVLYVQFILFCVCCLYFSICAIYIVLYVLFMLFYMCSLHCSVCAVYILYMLFILFYMCNLYSVCAVYIFIYILFTWFCMYSLCCSMCSVLQVQFIFCMCSFYCSVHPVYIFLDVLFIFFWISHLHCSICAVYVVLCVKIKLFCMCSLYILFVPFVLFCECCAHPNQHCQRRWQASTKNQMLFSGPDGVLATKENDCSANTLKESDCTSWHKRKWLQFPFLGTKDSTWLNFYGLSHVFCHGNFGELAALPLTIFMHRYHKNSDNKSGAARTFIIDHLVLHILKNKVVLQPPEFQGWAVSESRPS